MRIFPSLAAALALLGQAVPTLATAEAVRPPAERVVPLSGVQNFRDIGGYRAAGGRHVRWGLIYRSASLGGLGAADAERVAALRIRTIHDFRSTSERSGAPTQWPVDPKPAIHARDHRMDFSIFARGAADGLDEAEARANLQAYYVQILEIYRDDFRELFQTLLAAEGPVLYHCSAGKDRTGVATALILTALGVPRETVLADYELSNRYYRMDMAPAGRAGGAETATFARISPGAAKVFHSVDREFLLAVFQELDRRYGGVEGYLQKELGVGPQQIAQLRATYLQ